MLTVVIVIHLMIVLALIGVVLLQKSEGGGLGMGGGGAGGFLTSRGTANVLTRATAILATGLFRHQPAAFDSGWAGAQAALDRHPGKLAVGAGISGVDTAQRRRAACSTTLRGGEPAPAAPARAGGAAEPQVPR